MRGDEPRWERIERIFAAALEPDVVGLDAFIARECGDDHVLAAQVRELLAADAELRQGAASGFLEELDPVRAVALLDDVDEPGPGTMLGRYRIIRRLARGGNGVVYHAEDPGLRRPVALKLLSLHMGADDRAGRRLVNEARAASALDHPNIATVYEVGRTTDGQPFIAMAYYDGDTLRARIARGPLSGNETIDIATQVAEGLAAAHGKGIVHRDIKPENLILGADGRVRILDFGIAQVATPDKSAARGTFGTIAYMSPEQTRGDDTDARTDVWALGVVLHEMLAGRRPFADADTRVLIDRIRGEEATPLRRAAPDAAPELEAIVARCLEKVPDRRFADGAALARALRQLPGRSRPARGTRRVAVAVALYATVAAGIAWLVLTAAGGLPRITAVNGADAGESIARVVLTDHASADGDDADIAIALREALRVDLQQSGFVEVLTRTETASLLQRMSMPDSTRIDLPVARELAQRGGAGRLHRGQTRSCQPGGGRSTAGRL